MAEVSAREKVVLGYTASPLSISQTNSDVDFSDVFGGPPRRSSAQEFSNSKRNSIDVYDDGDGDGDCDTDSNDVKDESSSSWSRFKEKPVFGEVAGVRRRYTSDDFFDDIFRGDQSLSSSQSPRVVPRGNLFASAPGSRVMSPSRSLPPAEPFTGAAKFSVPVCSLPGRLTNTDFTASTSMTQNFFGPSLSRFTQSIQNHDASSSSSTQSSALCSQNSADVKESSSGTQLDEIENQSDQFQTKAKGSEFPIHATNFHFSIYKWASKDVPLIVSFRKKRGSTSNADTKLEQCFSGYKKGVGHDIHVIVKKSVKQSQPEKKSVKPSQSQSEQEHYNHSFVSSTTGKVKSKQEHTSPAESNPTNVLRTSNFDKKARGDISSSGLEDAARNVPLKALPKKNKSANETIIGEKSGHKTGMVEEKQKPSPIDAILNHKVEKTKEPKSSSPIKNDARKSEAQGKVKDFVKIFNKEPPSGLRQSHSRIWKDTKTVEVDYEIRFSSARMSDDMEASFVNWEEAWQDTSETMFQDDRNSSENHQFTMDDTRFGPDAEKQTSTNAPKADRPRDSAPSTNAASNNLNAMGKEATKGYETKVSQWSKGKEGNIRALLSTLQYVLWPESGWKPVPLVDIIEANAVKRAYQKALLRLHPDKLQQKGAAPEHKLIAEKIFDILQEAWDQFNSLGSL